jgi:hypothetical protein
MVRDAIKRFSSFMVQPALVNTIISSRRNDGTKVHVPQKGMPLEHKQLLGCSNSQPYTPPVAD